VSRIHDLMRELSSDGVEWRTVDDLGTLYGGLTGKSKADFTGGSARFVTYMNVFNNLSTNVSPDNTVRIGERERQNRVRYGDVLFTASSETAHEVGMASGVTVDPPEPLYLNSFCFGFRPRSAEDLDPEFSKHLFRSESIRRQIIRSANGVTRFNVSKERFRAVKIPVPPVAIQRDIASALNKMNGLEADLVTELASRSIQFSYYRDLLLAFSKEKSVPWRPMSEVGIFIRGRRFTKEDVVPEGLASIHYGEIYTGYGVAADQPLSRVRPQMAPSLRFASTGDVVIACVGETVEDVAKAVAWLGDEDVAIHDDCFAFRHSLNPKFVSYFFQTARFHSEKNKHVARAKVKRISGEGLGKILIPVPDRERQDGIVAILDKFNVLINDRSIGLPAEISLRRAQYGHYRDRLLKFEEAGMVEETVP
jgi:type I restriction enzyme, S subunit